MPLLSALHLVSALASVRGQGYIDIKGTLMLMMVIILSYFMLAEHTKQIKDPVQCYNVVWC